ncbi:MAG TPA: SIS domain-containing protein, partial [Propionibacteriaceae bacterium]|nr:SIS domain-containing protein [Propionibacteriaceae bacterium]
SDVAAGAEGSTEVAALMRRARRIVVTGNGAAYYAALTLWTAALQWPAGPEVVALPAGALAAGRLAWRPGDLLLVVSASGELRDIVDLLDGEDDRSVPRPPQPYALLTATSTSTLARTAGACLVVPVRAQRAVTHTQAFVGNVLALLLLWQEVTDGDLGLGAYALPDLVAGGLTDGHTWADALDPADRPAAAVTFGGGGGWPAALELALLLKEVAGIPAEGMETREGATSGMYPLRPGHLVVSVPTVADAYADEAEAVCGDTGARVVRLPVPATASDLVAPITSFPAALALAVRLGRDAGLDVDQPAWTAAYYRTARSTPTDPTTKESP